MKRKRLLSKDSQKIKRIANIYVTLFLIIMIILTAYIILTRNIELTQGENAIEFCTIKCGENKVLNSNNNSEYNFIRCKCIISINIGAYKTWVREDIKSKTYYFDSKSLLEVKKDDILQRIKS